MWTQHQEECICTYHVRFESAPGQRPLDHSHVNAMVRHIRENKNNPSLYLSLTPLTVIGDPVKQKYFISDGQHRREALRILCEEGIHITFFYNCMIGDSDLAYNAMQIKTFAKPEDNLRGIEMPRVDPFRYFKSSLDKHYGSNITRLDRENRPRINTKHLFNCLADVVGINSLRDAVLCYNIIIELDSYVKYLVEGDPKLEKAWDCKGKYPGKAKEDNRYLILVNPKQEERSYAELCSLFKTFRNQEERKEA